MYCELFTPDRWIVVGVELNPRDCCPNLSYPNRLQISTKKRIPFTPSAFRLANHHEHGNKNITTHVQVNPYNIIIFILLIPEAMGLFGTAGVKIATRISPTHFRGRFCDSQFISLRFSVHFSAFCVAGGHFSAFCIAGGWRAYARLSQAVQRDYSAYSAHKRR